MQLPSLGASLIVALLLAAPVQAQTTIDEKLKNDEVVLIPSDDPAMANAMRKARETLPDFLAKVAKPSPSWKGISVKIGLTEKGNPETEYVWISDFSQSGSTFKGIIANKLDSIKSYEGGDTIEFKQSDIVDWTYFDGTSLKGNFTACVLLKKEGGPEADAVMKKLRLDCSWMR